jgi:cytochrome oxidase Cu insertion factor (SCO1/SenC/PrrC family)
MRRIRFFKAAAAAAVVLSVLLVLSVVISACGSGGSASDPTASGVASGERAAEGSDLVPSFSGRTLDGQQVSLEQYRGKPLILVFMTYT